VGVRVAKPCGQHHASEAALVPGAVPVDLEAEIAAHGAQLGLVHELASVVGMQHAAERRRGREQLRAALLRRKLRALVPLAGEVRDAEEHAGHAVLGQQRRGDGPVAQVAVVEGDDAGLVRQARAPGHAFHQFARGYGAESRVPNGREVFLKQTGRVSVAVADIMVAEDWDACRHGILLPACYQMPRRHANPRHGERPEDCGARAGGKP